MEAFCFYQIKPNTSGCKFINIPEEYVNSSLVEIKNYTLNELLSSFRANGIIYSEKDINYFSLEFGFGKYISQGLQSDIKCPMCNKRNTTPVASNGGYVCNDCGTEFFIEKHITKKGNV